MRRRKGRSVAAGAAGLLLAAAAAYAVLPREVASALARRAAPPEISSSRTSSAYVLDRDRWTAFGVPAAQSQVKLVTNAGVPSGLALDEGFACEYSLRCQVVGSGGEVVREHDVVVRAGPLSYRDERTGQILPAQSYLGEPIVPLSPRITVLNLDGLSDPPHKLRLRQGPGDPRVRDVAARLYVIERTPRHKLRYLWQRLPLEKRERLARANVHSLELLTDAERQNLLENRWVALPAQGLRGRDYLERKIYSVREREGALLSGSILPRGLFVGPDSLGSIPLPEGTVCVRLELQRVGVAEPGAEAWVTWHGRFAGASVEAIRLEAPFFAASLELGPGLIEVESPDELVVRCFLEGPGAGVEVTPEARSIAGYLLRRDAPVTYALASRGETPGALRVDARRLFLEEPGARAAGAVVRYELLDASGAVLTGGVFSHDEPLSRHDRASGARRGWRVSEPSRRYFRLPAACAAVRLTSADEGVAVTGYTRPEGLERRVRVPEEYQPFERAQDDSRDWFHLRPENGPECVAAEREVFTRIQPRPPGSEGGGAHEARALRPLGGEDGLRVLAPAGPRPAEDRGASPAIFVRLRPGETRSLCLDGGPGTAEVRPRLVCLKETDRRATLAVRVDGRIHSSLRLASASSEHVLPPIPAGPHEVAVESSEPSEPCEVYLSRCGAVGEDALEAFVERTVARLGPRGLTYRVRKETPGRETLCLRAYGPEPPEPGRAIRASVRAAGRLDAVPLGSWTFGQTIYRIRPGSAGARAIGAREGRLAGGEPFLLVLGADLEPREHEVAFALEEGPPCFLQVTHVVPGQRERRRIFAERGALVGEVASDSAAE